MQDVNVQHTFHPRKIFADACFQRVVPVHFLRVEGNGVDPAFIGNEQGPLIVEFLRDHSDGILAEHFFASHHAVECAKARIIENDAGVRNAEPDQRIAHVCGLIVALGMVVAAQQQVMYLPRFIQLISRLHAVGEVHIISAAHRIFGSAEHKPHLACRDRAAVAV